MTKFSLLLSSFCLAVATATAGTVTFSTAGTFNCGAVTCGGNGTNAVTVNGVTLTYNTTSNTVVAPTGIQLGSFTVTGSSTSGLSLFAGISFTLNINQSAPALSPGGQPNTLSSSLSGSITSASQTNAYVTFLGNSTYTAAGVSGPGVQFTTSVNSPVTYVIVNNDLGGAYSGQAGNIQIQAGVNSSINARVQDAPEPVTMTLVGTGLGLAGLLRLRRRNNA